MGWFPSLLPSRNSLESAVNCVVLPIARAVESVVTKGTMDKPWLSVNTPSTLNTVLPITTKERTKMQRDDAEIEELTERLEEIAQTTEGGAFIYAIANALERTYCDDYAENQEALRMMESLVSSIRLVVKLVDQLEDNA